MIKKRVISTLLWNGRELVKGRNFRDRRKVGSMMQAIRMCEKREVDELIILDVAATPEGRGPLFEEIKEFTAECFMPVAIGGGIRSCADIRKLLHAGADKVVIGSEIFDPVLIKSAAQQFGSQAIVGAVDVSHGRVVTECGKNFIGLSPMEVADELVRRGVGEIILTSIDHEGLGEGFDWDLIHQIAEAVSVPVIAAGGAGSYEDLLYAFRSGVDAVAVGSLFLFTEATPLGARRFLHENGIPVRL